MKRFARCMNCRQWYVQAFTTPVEIWHGTQLCRVAVWCLRCVDAAERRSHSIATADGQAPEVHLTVTSLPKPPETDAGALGGFEQLMHQHIQLMDRALQEDETLLVPLVEDFTRRCRSYQQSQPPPEHSQRLQGYLRYWEVFLKTLKQSH